MVVLKTYFPNWRTLAIHESSPIPRGVSARLAQECPGYVASQFFPDAKLGELVSGVRCEDLEHLTFTDATFDIHITQDVMRARIFPRRCLS